MQVTIKRIVVPTEKEMALIQLYSNGHRTAEIADLMGINKRTAEAHADRIRAKYGFKTIAEACSEFIRNGIIK